MHHRAFARQYLVPGALAMAFVTCNAAAGQQSAVSEAGTKPFGSYGGTDIENVNLDNGSLNLRIPLYSLPQRGDLKVSYSLVYHNLTYQTVLNCGSGDLIKSQCTNTTTPSPALFGIDLVLDQALTVNENSTNTGIAEGNTELTPAPDLYYNSYDIIEPTRATHNLGYNGTLYRSIDGSGMEYIPPDTGSYAPPSEPYDPVISTANTGTETTPQYGTIIDSSGNQYAISPSTFQVSQITDVDGNQITINPAYAVTDTLARAIPSPTSLTSTSISSCPTVNAPNQTLTSAGIWSVPGYQGNVDYIFCYASMNISTGQSSTNGLNKQYNAEVAVLQSVVLPDGTYWGFVYAAANPSETTSTGLGNLVQVIFPTGGSANYSWTTYEPACTLGSSGVSLSPQAVQARTLIASGVSSSWQYAYSYTANGSVDYPTTTETDPLGDQTIHTFTDVSDQFCNLYETTTQYNQAPSSGSLSSFKTVTTQYQVATGYDGRKYAAAFPINITTTWPNGQSQQNLTSYDTGSTYSWYDCYYAGGLDCSVGGSSAQIPIGEVTSSSVYDYTSSLLKQTQTQYLWQTNGAYLSANLLNTPSSVIVYSSPNVEAAQTSYTYDGSGMVRISPLQTVSTQIGTPPNSVYGHVTTTTKWLNTGGTSPSTQTYWLNTGEIGQTVDSNGHATNYSYASTYDGAYPTQVTNALGQSSIAAYDFNSGLKISSTDPNSQTTSYTYDNLNRPKTVTYPDGGGSTFSYNPSGYPQNSVIMQILMCNGSANCSSEESTGETKTTLNLYDGLGRLTATELTSDPNGPDYTVTSYDLLGRVASVTNPYRSTSDPSYGLTSYLYDMQGRMTSLTHVPSASSQTRIYTGNAVLSTDENGNQWQRTYDALGRLTKVLEPNGSGTSPSMETDYSYDALDDLLSVRQWGGASGSMGAVTRSFTYDSLSRLLNSTNPEAGSITYHYDSNNNLTAKIDARGIATSYTYDALNRLTLKMYSDGTPSALFYYDGSGGSGGNCSGNQIGHLSATSNDINVSSNYCYDAMGRLTTQTSLTPDIPNLATTATYDLAGDIRSITYPDGRTVQNGYDAARRMSDVNYLNWNGISVGQSFFSESSGYDAAGQLTSATFGDGVPFSAGYDNRERVSNLAYGSTSAPFWSKQYAWTANSNLQSTTDLITGVQRQFNYDTLDRVTSAQDVFSNLAVPSSSNGDTGSTTTSGSGATETPGSSGDAQEWTNPDDSNLISDISVAGSNWGSYNATVASDAAAAPDGTTTATQVTAVSGSPDTYVQVPVSNPATLSLETITASVWLRSVTGTQTIDLYMVEVTPGGDSLAWKQVQLTTTWQQFEVTGAMPNNMTYLIFQIGGGGTVTSGESYMLWNPMLEDEGTAGTTVTNFLPYSQRLTASPWQAGSATVVDNAVAAPDGTMTASSLMGTSGTAGQLNNYVQNPASFAGMPVTASVWLRVPTTPQTVGLGIFEVNASGALAAINYQYVSVGTTWQRFQLSGTAESALSLLSLQIGGNNTIGNGQVVDIWGGQLELASVAGPYVATGATPVTMGTSMTNLLTYSQEPMNWSDNAVTVSSDSVVAPDGSTTAAQLTATSADSAIADIAPNPGLYDGATVTASVYLMSPSGQQTTTLYPYSANASGTHYFTPQTVSLTTSWQRFQITATLPTGLTALALQIGGGASFTTGEVIDVWGAQMEITPQAGPYVATTALPVVTGQQPTNILSNSQTFSGPNWGMYDGSAAVNTSVAPDGTTTGATFTAAAGSPDSYLYATVPNPSLYDGETVTASVYLRANSGTQSVDLYIISVGDQGSLIQNQASLTLTTSWQRFDLTTTLQNGLSTVRFQIGGGGTVQNGESFQVWGAQFVAGSAAAPYTPTTSTTTVYATGQVGTLVPTGLNQSYAYDSFGNILQNGSFNTAYTANNQMFGYAYDASGNLLSDRLSNVMTWDAESRMTSVGGATYLYDVDGNRVEKQSSEVTDTVYFGGQPMARYAAGQWTDLIYGPNGLLAEVPGTQAGAAVYRVTDNMGTDVGSLLANGSFVDPIDHTPFGQVITGNTSDPYFFTGKERDAESGNDYFGARYFGSSMGRFLSPDPAGPWAADVSDPQSWNFYAYALNNPLINIDPTGYDCVYLNDAGTGIDKNGIDTNSNSGECGQNGGYWVDGTFTSGTVYSNSNDVSLNGYDSGTTPGTGSLTSAYYTSATAPASPNLDTTPNIFAFSPLQPLPPQVLTGMISSLNFSGQSNKLIGCIVSTESSGRPGAKNPGSSATGLMGVEKIGAKDVAQHGSGGTFGGMNSSQLYGHMTDPAANIATGTSLLKLKVGYAKGNVQSGLDSYGTGAPYGQNELGCANGH